VYLESKREKLTALQNTLSANDEEILHAVYERRFTDASRLRDGLNESSKQIGDLSSQIADIEAKAWEPIVKGTAVLFYYNW
jgi:hypothetical protein